MFKDLYDGYSSSRNEQVLHGQIIEFDDDDGGLFPLKFKLDFRAFDQLFDITLFRKTFEGLNCESYEDLTRQSVVQLCVEDDRHRIFSVFATLYHKDYHEYQIYPSNSSHVIFQSKLLNKFSLRNKRQESSNSQVVATVEVLIVTDRDVYEHIKSFLHTDNEDRILNYTKQLLHHTFYMVNKIYENSFNKGLTIEFRINGLQLASVSNNYNDNLTLAPNAKSLFRLRNLTESMKLNFSIDHVMGFAGSRTDFEAVGVAFLARICEPIGYYSIIRHFITPLSMAHETGHNLGATHDENVGCNGSYLMGERSRLLVFSECSKKAIKKFLIDDNGGTLKACLTNGDKRSAREYYESESSHTKLPGSLYSLDEQCRLFDSKFTSACNSSRCQATFCQTTSGQCETYAPFVALDGTLCSNEAGVCMFGRCIIKNICLTEQNPCRNQARCVSNRTEYTCSCKKGFTGKHCDEIASICLNENITCSNHGTCKSRKNVYDYVCECNAGWYGRNCTASEPCRGVVCFNGGRCRNEYAGRDATYSCVCANEWSGRHCETLKPKKKINTECKDSSRFCAVIKTLCNTNNNIKAYCSFTCGQC